MVLEHLDNPRQQSIKINSKLIIDKYKIQKYKTFNNNNKGESLQDLGLEKEFSDLRTKA